MSAVISILVTIGLIVAAGVIANLTGAGPSVFVILVFGSAIWAIIDAKKLDLKTNGSGLARSPAGVFIAVVLLWIIAFPWYLVIRNRILKARAACGTKVQQPHASHPQVDATGRMAQLEKLADLKAKGVLSEDEFQQEKTKVLSA